MKRCSDKGFTTVELVIVIAVIAILATVLMPTFSNLIGRANESAALQEANSVLKSYFIDNADDTNAARDFYIRAKGYYFRVIDGQLQKDGDTTAPAEIGTIILSASPDAPYYKAEAVTAPEANGEAIVPTPDGGSEHTHSFVDENGGYLIYCKCGAYNPIHDCRDYSGNNVCDIEGCNNHVHIEKGKCICGAYFP